MPVGEQVAVGSASRKHGGQALLHRVHGCRPFLRGVTRPGEMVAALGHGPFVDGEQAFTGDPARGQVDP